MAAKLHARPTTAPSEISKVWDAILHRADQLELGPGDQLPSVRELAEQLAVKPTLVRDALLQAQARGVVQIVPRVGAFMQTTSPAARAMTAPLAAAVDSALHLALGRQGHNLLHLLDARRLVEVELIGRAAQHRRLEDLLPVRRVLECLLQLPSEAPRPEYLELDNRFHAELAQLAGNTVLAVFQRTLMDFLVPHMAEALADVPTNSGMRTASDRYHASIYAAVADGDGERARREMHEHLSASYDYLLAVLQQPPEAKAPSP